MELANTTLFDVMPERRAAIRSVGRYRSAAQLIELFFISPSPERSQTMPVYEKRFFEIRTQNTLEGLLAQFDRALGAAVSTTLCGSRRESGQQPLAAHRSEQSARRLAP